MGVSMRGFWTFLLVNALWLGLLFVALVIRRQIRAAFVGTWGCQWPFRSPHWWPSESPHPLRVVPLDMVVSPRFCRASRMR